MDQTQFGTWPVWITASYERFVGQPLCSVDGLYDLAAVVLCHDTSDDPLLVFTNQSAQDLWERPWGDFVGMPSRLTAPVDARSERAGALAVNGVARGYSGVRVSARGRRFRILDATVWPVDDESGTRRGQAATFMRTEPVEG